MFVKQEQGEIEQVFRGWEGQSNFICFDRRGKAKQVFVKQEQGKIEQVFRGWEGRPNIILF